MIWLGLYVVTVALAARVVGRRHAAYCVREWPDLHRDGFEADWADVALVAFLSAAWPLGIPLLFAMTADWDGKLSPRFPHALTSWLFGTDANEDDRGH